MNDDHTGSLGERTLLQHLLHNEQACVLDNIIVRVDSISADRRVVLCSVGQCLFGVFRRVRSTGELVWRAEQALAPLCTIGLVPMITVLPKPVDGNLHGAAGPGGWPAALWQWMGHPLARKGYGHRVLMHDPFGWRQAMAANGIPAEHLIPTT